MKRKIFAAAFAVCLLACSAVNVFASTAKIGGNGLYMDVYLESVWGSSKVQSVGSYVYSCDFSNSDDDQVGAEKLYIGIFALDADNNTLKSATLKKEDDDAIYGAGIAVRSSGLGTCKHKGRFTIYEDGRPRYKADLVNNRY